MQQQKSNNDFMSSFSPDSKKYLKIENGWTNSDISKWLLDSFNLVNSNIPNGYSDYSFMVVPASKALESWIFEIAKDLNIQVSTDKAGVIRDQIENEIQNLLGSIETKVGASITIDINYLKNFIKEYRHEIVHHSDKIENISMAKNKIFVIYERINSVTDKLIKAGLINIS